MREKGEMYVFGPVPSRRLGRSLGINNIPPKVCSYSCVYCQLGRTSTMSIKRKEFYPPRELLYAVETKVEILESLGERIDYLSFVPDGEPTLDLNLEQEIMGLKELGIKIAVITNASLLWQETVKESLLKADWVSLKIDAVNQESWRKINRPPGFLRLSWILKAIKEFSEMFSGELVTESMLIKGVNDTKNEIRRIADLIEGLGVSRSYISLPIRPPAESWVKSADTDSMPMVHKLFQERGIQMEPLTGFEGSDFISTGEMSNDLLAITAVHPMREDAVRVFVERHKGDWVEVEKLLRQGRLNRIDHGGHGYYTRKFNPTDTHQ